jgi:hypothetical protein
MSFWKLLIVLVVVAIIGVGGYDTVSVLNAHRDVRDAASATAAAAAHAITSPKDRDKARVIADTTAKQHGDVVIAFSYDPVAALVTVTVSGNADSLALHLIDKNLTDNIRASASARPG